MARFIFLYLQAAFVLSIPFPSDLYHPSIPSLLKPRQDDGELNDAIEAFKTPIDLHNTPKVVAEDYPQLPKFPAWPISDGSIDSQEHYTLYPLAVNPQNLSDFLQEALFATNELQKSKSDATYSLPEKKQRVYKYRSHATGLQFTMRCYKEYYDSMADYQTWHGWQDAYQVIQGINTYQKQVTGHNSTWTGDLLSQRNNGATYPGCDFLITGDMEELSIPSIGSETSTNTPECPANDPPEQCTNTNSDNTAGGGGRRLMTRQGPLPPYRLGETGYGFSMIRAGAATISPNLMYGLAVHAWDMIWASSNVDQTEYAGILARYPDPLTMYHPIMADKIFNLVTVVGERLDFASMLNVAAAAMVYAREKNWDSPYSFGDTHAIGGAIIDPSRANKVIAYWSWGTTVAVIKSMMGATAQTLGADGATNEWCQVTNPDGSSGAASAAVKAVASIGCVARHFLSN